MGINPPAMQCISDVIFVSFRVFPKEDILVLGVRRLQINSTDQAKFFTAPLHIVGDPDPDRVGFETFCRTQILNRINYFGSGARETQIINNENFNFFSQFKTNFLYKKPLLFNNKK